MAEYKPEKPWWQPGLTVFAEVTGWIVVPIVVALFLGKYLDERHNSAPWYYLGLTGVAFVISTIGIVIVASKYISQIDRENKERGAAKKLINQQQPKNKHSDDERRDNN